MRLQTKVLLLAVPLTAAFAALSALFASRVTETVMIRELGTRLTPQIEDYSARLSIPMSQGQESRILSPLQSAQEFTGSLFAETLDARGYVVAHTNVMEKGRQHQGEALKRALIATDVHFERGLTRDGPTLFISAPIWRYEEEFLLSGGPRVRLGTLRLGLPLKLTLDSARRLGLVVAVLAVGLCVLGLALCLVLVRMILGPVSSVSAATARVAAGDYTVKVPVPSDDEVGKLAESFNMMIETLSRTVVSRDRLEQALSLAKAAMNATADGILVVGPGLKAVSMNDRFVQMWNFPPELVAQGDMQKMAEFVLPQLEDPAAFLETTRKNSWDFDATDARDILRLKDGRVFERITSSFMVAGRQEGRTVTTRDLSSHYENLRAQVQALSVAQAAMDASADGILVVGPDLRIITANSRYFQMWDIPDELVATGDLHRCVELILPLVEDHGDISAMMEGSLDFAAEESRGIIRLKDGRVFERISRPYLIEGVPEGRTISLRDLTPHYEILAALSRARDEALEAARIKTQFLTSVSHEFRTPLNAVVGAAGLLGDTKLDGEQREYAETLSNAAHALLEMIEGILDFSKIEAGRMTVESMEFGVGAVLSDAVSIVAPMAAGKGLSLSADPGEAASLRLLGDPTRLRQVLTNLLANAVKFTDKGSVRADVRILPSEGPDALIEFSVHDTGIGITPAQGARLFSPFTQADSTMSRRYGGTGLGLAICKSLVELMGGTIGFESEAGRGARFWFHLKMTRCVPAPGRAAPAARSEPRSKADRAPARDRLRVLVVDDNETNRGLLVRQMERLGCSAVAVEGGDAAIARVRTDDFGLILMDCQMPGRDGLETTRDIRRIEGSRRRTPIIAVSGNSTDEDRRLCKEAGMDDFVAKPTSLEVFASVIDRWDRPYDETAFAAFADVAADSPEKLSRLLDDFLSDARARLQEASQARAKGDLPICAAAAHSVKGAAAAVGARGLRELARRIEMSAKAEEAGEMLDSLLGQAQDELARLAASRPKK